jgi:hypothetical protein
VMRKGQGKEGEKKGEKRIDSPKEREERKG